MIKKNRAIVGIIPAKNSAAKKSAKDRKPPEKYFKPCAIKWIELFEELVPPPPGEEKADSRFWKDDIEKRNLKLILIELRERYEEQMKSKGDGIEPEWTEGLALQRFEAFIRRAWEDNFISSNFILRMIYSFRIKIFNNQITPKNVTGKRTTGKNFRPEPKIKVDGDFGQL